MVDTTNSKQEKRLVIYQTVDFHNKLGVRHSHLRASVKRYDFVEASTAPSSTEGEVPEEEGNNPSSMDSGIELYHIVDQMVESPSSIKPVVRNCMLEDEHEEVNLRALGGKPEVALAVTSEVYDYPLLLSVLEVVLVQAFEPKD